MKVHIRGIRPLIIHSDLGLDPLDPLVVQLKSITKGKAKDTEESVTRVAWLKYQLAFYDSTDKPFIPSDNMIKSIEQAASTVKLKGGTRDVKAGLEIEEDEIEIIYNGPKTAREMFDFRTKEGDRPYVLSKSARIPPRTGSRVPTARPRIPTGWEMKFTLARATHCPLSESEIGKMVVVAGTQIGIGDWRPRYGLFEVMS